MTVDLCHILPKGRHGSDRRKLPKDILGPVKKLRYGLWVGLSNKGVFELLDFDANTFALGGRGHFPGGCLRHVPRSSATAKDLYDVVES